MRLAKSEYIGRRDSPPTKGKSFGTCMFVGLGEEKLLLLLWKAEDLSWLCAKQLARGGGK